MPALAPLSPLARRRAVSAAAPFTPASVAGLVLWLEADVLTGLVDGDPVATWPDRSGGGLDAAQAVGGNRPAYRTGVIGGLPVVRFDGVNDFLLTPSIAGTVGTVVAVLDTVSGGSAVAGFSGINRRLVTFYPTAATIYAGDGNEFFGTAFTTYVGGVATSAAPAGAFAVSQVATGSPPTAGAALGIGFDNSIGYWAGDLALWLLYGSALGATDRQAVEAWALTRYGL